MNTQDNDYYDCGDLKCPKCRSSHIKDLYEEGLDDFGDMFEFFHFECQTCGYIF